LRERGFTNLAVPRELRVLNELPALATGKINHRELETVLNQPATNAAENSDAAESEPAVEASAKP